MSKVHKDKSREIQNQNQNQNQNVFRINFYFDLLFRMREMYYKASDVSKEEIQAEEKEQRDAEVYSNLKTALQNRLYDVILNWNLFAPP